jgi:hypothetical protein
LAIDIYTKKCGYIYDPFWLLPIVHGCAYNPLAIVNWLLVLVIDIHTKAIVGMVIMNSLLPIVHWLLLLAIDIYTRAIVGMVITNWLLPIVHGYALNPLVINHHKWLQLLGIGCGLLAFRYF